MTQNNAPRIFTNFPSSGFKSSVVHNADLDLHAVEFGYVTAAQRLGESMKEHSPIDDLVLIPFMFLWRHAVELTLKNQLRSAIAIYSFINVDEAKADLERVKSLLERKHNLSQLFNELKIQFDKLDLPWHENSDIRIFHMLADSDTNGQAFRYAGDAKNDQSHIDFDKLAEALDKQYTHLSGGAGMLSERWDQIQDELEEIRFAQAEERAEFEAEMKADIQAELREYVGSPDEN